MSVDFTALRDAEIAPLLELVDAWSTAQSKLGEARTSYSEVGNGISNGDWDGEAAQTANVRSSELTQLIQAGVTEADAMSSILADGAQRFDSAKESLDTVISEIDGISQLRVDDSGKVSLAMDMSMLDPTTAAVWTAHAVSYQGRIDDIVDEAQTADTEISEALQLAAETDNLGDTTFNGDALNVDQLAQMREDIDRASTLINIDPEDITPGQLEELNGLIGQHGEHPVFAAEFMDDLGPDGLLERYGGLAIRALDEGDDEYTAQMRQLQANLGVTLATATDPDNQPHVSEEWVGELMRLGTESIANDDFRSLYPQGYEILAPLLEHGEYHEDFIVPVAEHFVRITDHAWDSSVHDVWTNSMTVSSQFDFYQDSDDRESYHPLNSALIALDQNPAAATAFFNGSQDYQDMPYSMPYGEEGSLPPVEDGNLTWMLDRAQSSDSYESPDIEVGLLGDALQAGTIGQSSDDSDGPTPQRTADMASLAEDTVAYLGGENVDAIEPGGALEEMTGNVTHIAASYMPDIHNGLIGSAAPDEVGIDIAGAEANFDRAATDRLLYALGKDEDSLYTLLGANDGAMAAMVAQGYETHGDDPDANAWLRDSVTPGAKVSGLLADGSATAIIEAGQQSDAEHNDRVDMVADGANLALSETPIGAFTGPFVDSIAGQYHIDTRVETTYDGQVRRSELEEGTAERTAEAVDAALMETHGLSAEEAEALRSEKGLTDGDIKGWFNDGYGVVEDDWR